MLPLHQRAVAFETMLIISKKTQINFDFAVMSRFMIKGSQCHLSVDLEMKYLASNALPAWPA